MFDNVDRDVLDARFGSAEIQAVAARDAEADVDTVVAEAIKDAAAEAAAFLSVRYTLTPSLLAPESLVPVLADIARFRLYDEAPTEAVKDAYVRAIDTLKGIAKGTINLFDTNPQITAAWDSAGVTNDSAAVAFREGRDRVFTHATLADF